jgi:hypothetical protein
MLALPPTARRSDTISSSSVASADEPSTPFGLGERRTGDAVLSALAVADVDVAEGGVVVPLVLGRAMGAMGRPMRPTSGAGVALTVFELPRRPAPGARPELGGAMGACGRGGKDMSNGPRAGPGPGAAGKPGGSADGARGWTGGANEGPGTTKGVVGGAKGRGGPLGEKRGDGWGGGIGWSCGVTGIRGCGVGGMDWRGGCECCDKA